MILLQCIILRQHSQPCRPSWTALSQVLYITPTTLILPSHPFTYPSGSYNYNSIKICKQISTPSQPYQKIPDIYFIRSFSLPNFITIPSPITIQFVVDAFVLYVILYLLLYCLLCYLVLQPQSWINSSYYYIANKQNQWIIPYVWFWFWQYKKRWIARKNS